MGKKYTVKLLHLEPYTAVDGTVLEAFVGSPVKGLNGYIESTVVKAWVEDDWVMAIIEELE